MTTGRKEAVQVLLQSTGLLESMLAAALARHGMSVLHVDPNPFYGDQHATWNLEELMVYATRTDPSDTAGYAFPSSAHSRETLLRLGRQFAFDRTAILLPCRGKLVDTLMRSGIGTHLEFQLCADIRLYQPPSVAEPSLDDQLDSSATTEHTPSASHLFVRVPMSKEDVFLDQQTSLVDKRKLMRFLGDILAAKEKPCDPGIFLDSYLVSQYSLDSRLRNVVAYAIAFLTEPMEQVPAAVAISRARLYLQSMQRFGKGALLSCMYGSRELSQAFCRTSAVHGGIYMLEQPALALKQIQDGGRVTVPLSDGTSTDFEFQRSYTRKQNPNDPTIYSRVAVVLLQVQEDSHRNSTPQDSPPSGDSPQTLFVFPPGALGNHSHSIYAIRFGNECGRTPAGYMQIHAWSWSASHLQDAIRTCADRCPILFEAHYASKPGAGGGDILQQNSNVVDKALELFIALTGAAATEFLPAKEDEPAEEIPL